MEKGVRQRIGGKYAAILPLAGLTSREAAGARVWARMPAAQKLAIKEAGKDTLKKAHARRRALT